MRFHHAISRLGADFRIGGERRVRLEAFRIRSAVRGDGERLRLRLARYRADCAACRRSRRPAGGSPPSLWIRRLTIGTQRKAGLRTKTAPTPSTDSMRMQHRVVDGCGPATSLGVTPSSFLNAFTKRPLALRRDRVQAAVGRKYFIQSVLPP